jgi:hypothetical protein
LRLTLFRTSAIWGYVMMCRSKRAMPHVVFCVLAIAGLLGSGTIVLAADAPTSVARPNSPLNGCRVTKKKMDPYARLAKQRSLSGRVLALVERSPEGVLKVLRIAISNPPDLFDASVLMLFESFECEPVDAAKQGYVSITFSMHPGPDFPHFDGADDELSVRGQRLPPGAR